MDCRLLPSAAAAWLAAWWLTGSGAAQAWLPAMVGATLALAAAAAALLTRHSGLDPTRHSGLDPESWHQPTATSKAKIADQVHNDNRALTSIAAHLALLAAALLAVSASFAAASLASRPLVAAVGTRATVIGTVVSDPKAAPFGGAATYEVQVAAIQTEALAPGLESTSSLLRSRGTVIVTGPAVEYRSRVAIAGQLEPTPPDRAAGAMIRADQLEITQRPQPWWRPANAARAATSQLVARLPGEGAGLVADMAVGDTARMSPQLRAAFRDTGLAHLTAVSGSHFAVMIAAVGMLAAKARAPAVKAALLGGAAVAFVLLVRPGPSVLRAFGMCALALLASLLGRRATAIPALCAVVLVLLATDPFLARSFGFALSCSASAALATFSNPLAIKLTPWLGAPLAYLVAVPAVAQAACLPVLALFAPGLATTAVLANLAVAPAVASTTLLGLLAAVLAPVLPQAAWWVARLAAIPAGWIARVALFFSSLPGSTIPWPTGAWGSGLALVVVVVLGLAVWRWQPRGWPDRWRHASADTRKALKRRAGASVRRYQYGLQTRTDRALAATAAVLGALALFGGAAWGAGAATAAAQRVTPLPDWQFAVCDVGQGDGLVARTGSASAMVIDVGDDDGAMARCLSRLGVKRIDLLILTHYHKDHAGGLAGVLAGTEVLAVIGPARCDADAQAAQSILGAAGLEVEVPGTGLAPAVGENDVLYWRVWNTGYDAAAPLDCTGTHHAARWAGSANDASLAAQVWTGIGADQISLLSLGDLELPGQAALLTELRSGGAASRPTGGIERATAVNADIVKVAHHGSAKQSAPLARYLAPKVAAYSVGAENRHGHPAPVALELYEGTGAMTLRTDLCGTILFAKRSGDLVYACA